MPKRVSDQGIRGKCSRQWECYENGFHGFINPLSTDLDPDKLYNLASGCLLPDDISKGHLSIHEDGKSMQDKFNTRLNTESPESELFFSPIKRVKWRGFRNSSKKVKVTKGG